MEQSITATPAYGPSGESGDQEDTIKAARIARLNALGESLATKRREAIQFRKQSGLEAEWDECEDAYNGEDEVSKASFANRQSQSRDWSVIRDEQDNDNRSTVVLNITKPYVNAVASKIIDMRLSLTGRAWAFRPTPIPELEDMSKQSNIGLLKDGQPVMVVEDGQQRQATNADMAARDQEKATKKAEKAQKQVDDWMVESHWESEARQAIDDMARIGTGVLKGPFPQKFTYRKYVNGKLETIEKIKPTSKRISCRNLYPDPACGENIHNGDYIWDWDGITTKRLKDLKKLKDSAGRPIYIASQIDAVIAEGPRAPDVVHDENKPIDPAQKSKPYQIWYYYGTLNKEDLAAAECNCEEGQDDSSVIVAMVNDHVIRASIAPLNNNKFPFDVVPCARREGYWAGVGIAKDLMVAGKMVIGANRSMLENAGLSAKPITAIMQGLLVPADGNNVLYGGKVFIIPKGTDIAEAKAAIFTFQVESRQAENMAIIQFALKMAENVTGLPMILQGQQGQAPDLVGVVQILDKNASTVANRVAKMYDDNLLEPHVGGYYDWLMQNTEDEEMKGDYTIDVLPPPDIVADKQALIEMFKLSQDLRSRVDPVKQYAEFAKSNRFDPARLQYSDAEWEKIQKQAQPSDPRIAVAQLKIEADAKELAATQAFDKEQNALKLQSDEFVAMINKQIAESEMGSVEQQVLEKIKAELAQTSAKLNLQDKLSAQAVAQANDHEISKHRVDIYKHNNPVLTPPTEPQGKAAPGNSFQA